MSCSLSIFPHINEHEFKIACDNLVRIFHQHGKDQDEWLTVEVIHTSTSTHLRITTRPHFDIVDTKVESEDFHNDFDEQDDEAIDTMNIPTVMQYDIVLSPIYQVPVLYIDIIDHMHRFPPTMDALYEYIIPEQYKSQTKHVGVIGGITTQHHPVTDKPMFFIHPCQTSELMTAALADSREVHATDYLMIWLGAMGTCVGLNAPLALSKDYQSQKN